RTSAYAFTDYRSQGQTIPYEVVNTAKPPSGVLNLSNFSRMSHSRGARVSRPLSLKDFDDTMFLSIHTLELLAEGDRKIRYRNIDLGDIVEFRYTNP
ncbi:hypothetical protein EDC04DRAFT_802266, partial [Pisolithus marmoratus]